jgi:hypothetical protein
MAEQNIPIEDLREYVHSATLPKFGAPLQLDASVEVIDLAPTIDVKTKTNQNKTPKIQSTIAEDASETEIPHVKPEPLPLQAKDNGYVIQSNIDYKHIDALSRKLDTILQIIEDKQTKKQQPTYELKTASISIQNIVDTDFMYYTMNAVGPCVVFVIPNDAFNIKTKSTTKVLLKADGTESNCVLVEKPIPLVGTDKSIVIFFTLGTEEV